MDTDSALDSDATFSRLETALYMNDMIRLNALGYPPFNARNLLLLYR